ncbi:MAG: hypothetical protein AAGJ86_04575 [Pseudomonadota bacterium]
MIAVYAALLDYWFEYWRKKEPWGDRKDAVIHCLLLLIALWPIFVFGVAGATGLIRPDPNSEYEFPFSRLEWLLICIVAYFVLYKVIGKSIDALGGETGIAELVNGQSDKTDSRMRWAVRLINLPLVGFFVACAIVLLRMAFDLY